MLIPQAIQLIQSWEGIMDGDPSTANLDPYLCPADYWTIGWGHVVLGPKGEMLHGQAMRALAKAAYPNGITMDQAKVLLAQDCTKYERAVISGLRGGAANPFQVGAMAALTMNAGQVGFMNSSVLRFHLMGRTTSNSNRDRLVAIVRGQVQPDNAPDAFMLWNKITRNGVKVVSDGLVNRRGAERRLYMGMV